MGPGDAGHRRGEVVARCSMSEWAASAPVATWSVFLSTPSYWLEAEGSSSSLGMPWSSLALDVQTSEARLDHSTCQTSAFSRTTRRFRGSQASFYLMLLSRGRKSASLPCGCLCSMPTRRRALNSHHRRQPWASDAVRAGDGQIACTFPFAKAIQSCLWPLQLFVHSQRAFSVLSRRRPAGQRPST